MIDVVIKSYNRAYLLDRTIYSVLFFAKNIGDIIVLDDGTPEIYLTHLKSKYPNIIVKQSNVNLDSNTKSAPPVQFWKQEIDKCSRYVLLLEDDIWLNQEVDFAELEFFLGDNKIDFFKLKWWGNDRMISGEFVQEKDKKNGRLIPKLNFLSEVLVTNRYYIHTIARLLKIIPQDYFLSLYTIYDVAGQVFSKDYYNYVWPDSQISIEEMIQLGLGAKYFRLHKDRNVGRSLHEMCSTTFCSSSVGKIEKYGFNMDDYNDIWNKNWKEGKLNSLYQFPMDFTLGYLKQFLTSSENVDKWENWSISWRKHFIELGSDLSQYNNINELQ
ncbi:MAG: hypothetical protein DI598_04445 [Pseudopedobacter saltans]|uniref:Glycosyl transferase family 2 n=1 Tax=Pseudopedobacter saltans TaxID=151895 RepID=A0A2W5F7X8_9SPHI|nr:MAG: hypothetical protein DI598_04445 [Pseudopedobacter saltans]